MDIRPGLKPDARFVAWFVTAYLTGDETNAVATLTGISGDRGADAVKADEDSRTVFIVQGKYRKGISRKSEPPSEVREFAHLAMVLCGSIQEFETFLNRSRTDPLAKERLTQARERIQKRGYRLQLLYATTGRCGENLRNQVQGNIIQSTQHRASIEFFDGTRVLHLLQEYLGGVAPPVPFLDLEFETDSGVGVSGPFRRQDMSEKVDSWVFSMNGRAVADLYGQARERLFARNVRGFLGDTEINKSIARTIRRQPRYFWYYNNGITIVCEDVSREEHDDRAFLRVQNPQVINGQQTTRQLFEHRNSSRHVSVLVRVIKIPRSLGGRQFEALINEIVKATNWQNRISNPDLRANDSLQILIDRELRNLGRYSYLRKRMTKGEAKRRAGRDKIVVTKEEFAYAVATCDMDPNTVVSQGKERIFGEDLYKRVFRSVSVLYYLTRYWLMRAVQMQSSRFGGGKYARWLILNFLWARLSPVLASRSAQRAFVESMERGGRYEEHLVRSIRAAYASAFSFYREGRGKGPQAVEAASFFKRPRLDIAFEKFWKLPRNSKRRRSFTSNWQRFEITLKR